ncbi:NAD(P)/FAD-dependent oxidoreductase [Frankia sp. QA3]|uniref:NAD(P)/FAD-dependent oxidoreductase n=1 Tax=Frankia sp. QA3 TaxID=710111 RepID=UPI000269BB32|nr:NADH dehydrogenase, FAD-containing subunit [Frankia sp. QA3]
MPAATSLPAPLRRFLRAGRAADRPAPASGAAGSAGSAGSAAAAGAPRVVVVGSGFAGLRLLRRLEGLLPASAAELTVVSPVDHLLYTSLMPQVCASSVEPRHLAVATRGALRRTVLRLGHAVAVDTRARTVTVHGNDGTVDELGWDRLVLAPGSVTRTFDLPGVREHAIGLKNLAEAVHLRDHVLRQFERADATADDARRHALCTFVIVGAGYTGTELAAQMTRFSRRAVANYPRVRAEEVRWVLVDHAPRLLHELAPALGRRAADVLTARGVELRLRTSVNEVTERTVRLGQAEAANQHETIDTHTVVWCAGVSPSPLMTNLGLPTTHGRLVVDDCFRVPEVDGLFALGDAAAVPDVTRSGAPAGQTAQHAVRQAAAAARNVAASLGHGTARPYRHRDLGFVVDLGGRDAVANPLGLTLHGLPAAVVTRAYHAYALNNGSNRARVLTDWALDLVIPHQIVQLGFADGWRPTIAATEQTGIYPGAAPQRAGGGAGPVASPAPPDRAAGGVGGR